MLRVEPTEKGESIDEVRHLIAAVRTRHQRKRAGGIGCLHRAFQHDIVA
jgi:hypothetical protein